MPLYEYECEAENGRRFEIIQKFSDEILTVCPTCGGPGPQAISSPAIQFKGSGFYITDYAEEVGDRRRQGIEGLADVLVVEAIRAPVRARLVQLVADAGRDSTPAKKD